MKDKKSQVLIEFCAVTKNFVRPYDNLHRKTMWKNLFKMWGQAAIGATPPFNAVYLVKNLSASTRVGRYFIGAMAT